MSNEKKAYYKILKSIPQCTNIEQMYNTNKWIRFFKITYQNDYLYNLLQKAYLKKSGDKKFIWF